MEVLIGLFICMWLVLASVISYRHLKKEFENADREDGLR